VGRRPPKRDMCPISWGPSLAVLADPVVGQSPVGQREGERGRHKHAVLIYIQKL
jgi:hypothetical protein